MAAVPRAAGQVRLFHRAPGPGAPARTRLCGNRPRPALFPRLRRQQEQQGAGPGQGKPRQGHPHPLRIPGRRRGQRTLATLLGLCGRQQGLPPGQAHPPVAQELRRGRGQGIQRAQPQRHPLHLQILQELRRALSEIGRRQQIKTLRGPVRPTHRLTAHPLGPAEVARRQRPASRPGCRRSRRVQPRHGQAHVRLRPAQGTGDRTGGLRRPGDWRDRQPSHVPSIGDAFPRSMARLPPRTGNPAVHRRPRATARRA